MDKEEKKGIFCGLNKAVTFGFDDGETFDRPLAELLRKYGLKATFFLCSGQLGVKVPFRRYGKEITVEKVGRTEIGNGLYRGMEIAGHGREHRIDEEDIEGTVSVPAEKLSALAGYSVCGLAYPGGEFTEKMKKGLQAAGVVYARTCAYTYGFGLPDDLLEWRPTCHYADPRMEDIFDAFLKASEGAPALLYIMGHSYEFTREEAAYGWARFERGLKRIAGRKEIFYGTNAEVARCIAAFDQNRRI